MPDVDRNHALLEKAIAIAVKAHARQRDKQGLPYILHPLRVMELVRPYGPKAMMAAVLHDVVEDTSVSLAGLRRDGMPEDVVEAVDALSRRGDGYPPGIVWGETYWDYIERVKLTPLAIPVKIADSQDNTRPDRAGPRSAHLRERYLKTIAILTPLTGP